MDSSDSSYYSRQQLDELFLQMIAFFSLEIRNGFSIS